MPRISAKNITQHREQQVARLLEAAKHILITDGPLAVNPGSVAKLAGISRPAVYQYFENGTAMIERAVIEDFEKSIAALDAALAGSSDPRTRAHAYVENVIRQASEGMHLSATALANFPMPAAFTERIGQLHVHQVEPFKTALIELGVQNPVDLALMGGLVETGVRLAEAGLAPAQVAAAICRQIDAALNSIANLR